jgi:hypothetical protein
MKTKLALLAGLSCLAFSLPVFAQSASAGLTLYNINCQDCHGTPPNLRDGANKGAGNATTISRAISSNKGGMGYLSTLTSTELSSIATYLANPSVATTTTTTSSADRVLNWAESHYASLLQSHQTSGTLGAYTYRCYAAAALCIGIDSTQVYLYETNNPAKGIYAIGALSTYLGLAQSNGF